MKIETQTHLIISAIYSATSYSHLGDSTAFTGCMISAGIFLLLAGISCMKPTTPLSKK